MPQTFSQALANAYVQGAGSLTIGVSANGANQVNIVTLGNTALGIDHQGFYVTTANQLGFQIIANGVTYAPAANGYTLLPNGFILQWGWVSATNAAGNATFPLPFPNQCLNVSATSNSTVATYQPAVVGANSTVVQIRTANAAATNCYYHAIGF